MAAQIVSATYTYPNMENGLPIGSLVVHLACTSATGGAVSYAIPTAIMEKLAPVALDSSSARRSKYYLYLVMTDPGATAPSANWDLTVADAGLGGNDVLGGAGLNRSDTATEWAVPTVGTAIPVCGQLTVAVANADDEKTFTVNLFFSCYR
jgi:hypothetical protein